MPQRIAAWFVSLICLSGAALADEAAIVPLDAALRERCLAVLREGVQADEFWPAMHAAEALSLAGEGQEVLAELAKRSSDDDQQRCGLAREAVRAGDRSQITRLLEILGKQGSNGHIHAAESLFKIAEVGDGKLLRKALAQNENPRLKLMAAAALVRCGHPTALQAVRDALASDDREVRKVAIWVLGQLGAASDVTAIKKALQNESDTLALAYGNHALACLGDKEGRAALSKNLNSSDPAVRTYAADFAGPARCVEFRDRLIELLDDKTLDVRVRAAQSLIAFSLPPHQVGLPVAVAQEDILRHVYPASAANPRYSEGSIAALRDGSLLFVTTEFIGGGADHATAQIIGRTSTDGGRTWGEPRVVQANTGKQNVMSATLRRLEFGNPVGPLAHMYLVKNSPTDLKAYLRISTDEAKSFGPPVVITDAPGYHVVNNDRLTVLSTGRLVCPVAWTADVSGISRGGSHFVCFCYLSDDGGKTWRKGTDQVDQPQRGAMEPEVIELSDGRVMMIIRTQLGRIATSYSDDGGDHWSEPAQLSVVAPESPATIRRIPATGDLLLVWNNNHEPGTGHSGKRTPLTTAISTDEGKTWTHVRNLENRADQSYAYTSIAFVRDRVVMSYYVGEKGRISNRFRSLPVSWLYAGDE